MALMKLVKFVWQKTGFKTEPESVYLNQADLIVVAPRGSGEIIIRACDPEKRIWATFGLSHEEAEKLIGQIQLGMAVQELQAEEGR